ncbi:gamma-glutamyl kinase [Pseudoalteromonas tunicata D2]|uniref:Gamma-glutamyl kinase n=1 Tax=Pseudoalteromonas tunicata D2 TaxID=87626 RepID=A4C3K1_9GAMM|nr:gamma-glutamyl kinase [Pseudoalteromonas tunicata D2]
MLIKNFFKKSPNLKSDKKQLITILVVVLLIKLLYKT